MDSALALAEMMTTRTYPEHFLCYQKLNMYTLDVKTHTTSMKCLPLVKLSDPVKSSHMFFYTEMGRQQQ